MSNDRPSWNPPLLVARAVHRFKTPDGQEAQSNEEYQDQVYDGERGLDIRRKRKGKQNDTHQSPAVDIMDNHLPQFHQPTIWDTYPGTPGMPAPQNRYSVASNVQQSQDSYSTTGQPSYSGASSQMHSLAPLSQSWQPPPQSNMGPPPRPDNAMHRSFFGGPAQVIAEPQDNSRPNTGHAYTPQDQRGMSSDSSFQPPQDEGYISASQSYSEHPRPPVTNETCRHGFCYAQCPVRCEPDDGYRGPVRSTSENAVLHMSPSQRKETAISGSLQANELGDKHVPEHSQSSIKFERQVSGERDKRTQWEVRDWEQRKASSEAQAESLGLEGLAESVPAPPKPAQGSENLDYTGKSLDSGLSSGRTSQENPALEDKTLHDTQPEGRKDDGFRPIASNNAISRPEKTSSETPINVRCAVENAPKSSIVITSTNDTSLLNKFKAFLEDRTVFDWDWWPLMPRVPDVSPGRFRLQWERLYTEISQEDAEFVRRFLESADDHPPRCSCCMHIPRRVNWTALVPRPLRQTASLIGMAYPQPYPAENHSSIQGLSHFATDTGAPIFSATTSHGQPQAYPNINSVQPHPASLASAPQIPLPINQQWILFGVKNMSDLNTLEPIEVFGHSNDQSFFEDLKLRHKRYRWFFQRWFSPFLFRNCKFVQFDNPYTTPQNFVSQEGLPDGHNGVQSHPHPDYDFSPRPPTEIPPISRGMFGALLGACPTDCMLCWLPQFLHTPRPLSRLTRHWEKIPRKQSMLDQWDRNAKFGIEADYKMSSAIVLVYHVGLLFSGFGFWIYWLKKHPDDLQNASVPIFTILGIMASLWGFIGLRRGVS